VFFSNDYLAMTGAFFSENYEVQFNELFSAYLNYLFENSNKIDWIEPKTIAQNTPFKKKIASVLSELILNVYFLFNCFNNNNDVELDASKSPQTSSNATFRDLLIFNYNEIVPTEILLLYAIKQYFRPIPLGFSKSEMAQFQIKVIQPQKKLLFEFLHKLVLKRPEDFPEESVAFRMFLGFSKFLKTIEKDNIVFELNKNIKRVIRQFTFPCLESDYFNYGQNKKETVDLFYKTKFNEFSPQEIVKILTIIDLKFLWKFNKNTEGKISKKNEERYNFFINFLVLNVILNPKFKRQYYIIENYYKIVDILYREKNYSSLLMYFSCLSNLEMILPKTMKNLGQIQKNHLKESAFYGTLLDGSYEQISNKWKNDLNKNYICIPFLNYYQRHLNFTDYKNKEPNYLSLGKMKKIAACFNEIHEIKTICSQKISGIVKDFVKNECYYFLKKDYKLILQSVIPNLETITNQELERQVWNMAEELEKVFFLGGF